MPNTVPLTSQEIDDGWCLEEEPVDKEPYEEFILETNVPSSAFEEAYWEQVEDRKLTRHFGDGASTFGLRPVS